MYKILFKIQAGIISLRCVPQKKLDSINIEVLHEEGLK